MEYVTISPPFISSARPLKEADQRAYVREGDRLVQLLHEQHFSYGIFECLGEANSAKANCLSLYYHQLEQQNPASTRSGFLAIFKRPMLRSQRHFDELLDNHIKAMHRFDHNYYDVSPYLIHSHDRKEFEFSLGGRIYGIKDYHPLQRDSSKFYDLVMLSFDVKYNGRQVFPPRQNYSPLDEGEEYRKMA